MGSEYIAKDLNPLFKWKQEESYQPIPDKASFTSSVHFAQPNQTRQCRPPGAPPGAWKWEPWWHSTFYDPYERVNIWSHGIPGLAFLAYALLVSFRVVPGSLALMIFLYGAAAMHICSAVTHIYPDSFSLEKLDHLAIAALIVAVVWSAVQAYQPNSDFRYLYAGSVVLLGVAFLPPLPRTLAYALGGVMLVLVYGAVILNKVIVVETVMYMLGGICFVSNMGHKRGQGLADHHFLHYFSTSGCILHLFYLHNAGAL